MGIVPEIQVHFAGSDQYPGGWPHIFSDPFENVIVPNNSTNIINVLTSSLA